MGRYFIGCVLFACIIFIFNSGCRQKSPAIVRNNYVLSWDRDSAYVLLQDYRPDTSDKNPQHTIIEADKGGPQQFSVIQSDGVPAVKMAYGEPITAAAVPYSTIRSHPSLWYRPFKPDSARGDILENFMTGYTLSHIQINSIIAGHVNFYSARAVNLNINASAIDYLAIHGDFIGPVTPLVAKFDDLDDRQLKQACISYKAIKSISIGQHIGKLILNNCEIGDSTATITGRVAPDTLELDTLAFTNPHARLDLKGLGVLNQSRDKQTVLICNQADLSRIKLDYTLYRFLPLLAHHAPPYLNAYYSADKQQFGRLIAGQRQDYNEGGKKAAEVDSARFEDQAAGIPQVVITVKTWWNNYGYTKYKIFRTAAWLYLGVLLINLCFFRWLRRGYEISEVEDAYHRFDSIGSKWLRIIRRLPVYAYYSAYIFFGLKLDLNKLKLNNMLVAFIILFEYTLGIVVLGYIANLIISR